MDFTVDGLQPAALRLNYTQAVQRLARQFSSVVEQRFCKPSVVGSNPTTGSAFDVTPSQLSICIECVSVGSQLDYIDKDGKTTDMGARAAKFSSWADAKSFFGKHNIRATCQIGQESFEDHEV